MRTTVFISDRRGHVLKRDAVLRGDVIEFEGETCFFQNVAVPAPAKPEMVHWLGMTWEGVPWPKRIRARWPVYCKPLPGCGCVRKAKQATRSAWPFILSLFTRRRMAARNGA